jgi:chromosome segregation ATPase
MENKPIPKEVMDEADKWDVQRVAFLTGYDLAASQISKLEGDLKEKEGEIKKQTNLKTEYKEMYQNACAKIADLEKELEELRMENENLQSDLKEGYD